jgi:hypothetical protein
VASRALEINAFLQQQLRLRHLGDVTAVEAARWLDRAALLKDSAVRPGLPLRRMLRAGGIDGAIQRPVTSHGRWFISRAEDPPGSGARVPPVEKPPWPVASRTKTDEHKARLRARRRREQAARKYRPASVKLLLVAEAPPSSLNRYFYFDVVAKHDSLFRYVARSILKVEPTRTNKAELLDRLRDHGLPHRPTSGSHRFPIRFAGRLETRTTNSTARSAKDHRHQDRCVRPRTPTPSRRRVAARR